MEPNLLLSDDTRTLPEPKPTHRARVSNGSKTLAGVDGRTAWARRFRDIMDAHVFDLGGPENVSHAERAIIRRSATLICELERLERKFALAGEAEVGDLDLYQRAANTVRRLLEAVGLERRARDVTPSLTQYLQQKDTAP
jgi:hypothetical protein